MSLMDEVMNADIGTLKELKCKMDDACMPDTSVVPPPFDIETNETRKGDTITDKAIIAIENAVRWNYYDMQCGNYSADPSRNGMDMDILSGLVSCIDSARQDVLAAQGKAWAKAELNMPYEKPTWGCMKWSDAEKLIDQHMKG